MDLLRQNPYARLCALQCILALDFQPRSRHNMRMSQHEKPDLSSKPIFDCLHFLMRLVLARLPKRANVLCVGIGTGAEMLSLAVEQPNWSFVGVDPSSEKLTVARRRLDVPGILNRCQLVQGHVEDVSDKNFDAVVSLLVAHFIQLEDRPAFYTAIHDRLKPGGMFVSAEISVDLDALEFSTMLEDWKQVQTLMEVSEESLAALYQTLRNVLGIVPPTSTKALWLEAGFSQPVPFFQALLVHGWHAQKPML